MQGAAASTIYGAQGANGVIQIFTKKGQPGKVKIDIKTSAGLSNYLNIGNVHEAKLSSFKTDDQGNFIDNNGNIITPRQNRGIPSGVNWAYGADNSNPTAMSNPLNIAHQQYGTNLKYYDHYAQLFKTAYNANNSVNISGANGNTDYDVGISNAYQESNIRNKWFKQQDKLNHQFGN